MTIYKPTSIEELNTILKKGGKNLAHFYATWNGPCQAIAPYVINMCSGQGINLIKIDVDLAAELLEKYNIQAMPTFMVFDDNGESLLRIVGGGQSNVDKCLAFLNK
jgi:thioredoxin 1